MTTTTRIVLILTILCIQPDYTRAVTVTATVLPHAIVKVQPHVPTFWERIWAIITR